jgi:prevent-host-death family protein
MRRKALSVAEAKATLSDAIRDVEAGGSVLITRRGEPVAALVRPEDLAALERLRAAGPAGGLASVAGGWEGSDELATNVAAAARRGRRRPAVLD